jgi:hypothetical protein
VQFTLDDFHAENPTHILVNRLRDGAFGRGLPLEKELSADLNVAALFRTLIQNPFLEEGQVNQEAVDKCHRNGWIHAVQPNPSSSTYYTFASPLHSTFISWILAPTNDMPSYPSVVDLCTAVISKFKPSQMHIPERRVGSSFGTVDALPEAQYQDEFYRSLFKATAGNVRISPEFASARGAHVIGRIDFFIPTARWGIEIIRDGHDLKQHSSCFEARGAYGAWLKSGDMADYILLDCRTKVPHKPHSSKYDDSLLQ